MHSTIKLTDLHSGAVRSTIEMNGGVTFASLTPDNRHLVTTCTGHTQGQVWDQLRPMQVRDAHSGKLLTSFTNSPDRSVKSER